MRLDDAGDEGEAEPATARPAPIGPPESPKYVPSRRLRNTRAAIEHIDRARRGNVYFDRTVGRGMGDGVLDEVAQGLEQGFGIAFDPDFDVVAGHRDLLALGQRQRR